MDGRLARLGHSGNCYSYAAAWDEWDAADEQHVWESATGDGIG